MGKASGEKIGENGKMENENWANNANANAMPVAANRICFV